jgi:hypothetical protein
VEGQVSGGFQSLRCRYAVIAMIGNCALTVSRAATANR